MPAPFALLVGLLIGMTLAWISRSELARSEGPLVLARPFVVTTSLAALIFAPIVGYFLAFHGDWSSLYLVRYFYRIPSALVLAFVIFAALQIPIGFAVAAPLARSKQSSKLAVVVGILLILLVLGSALLSRRLGSSASFAQFQGGFGTIPIGKSPLGRGVLLAWTVLTMAYAWAVHVLRSGREAR